MAPWNGIPSFHRSDMTACLEPQILSESFSGGPEADDGAERIHTKSLQPCRYRVNTFLKEGTGMNRLMRNERLKQIVGEKQIESAAEFARATGLKESTARAYLLGTRSPPLEVCRRIGQALGVSGDWIYYGRGSKDAGRVSMALTATPSDLVFAAVEEAFLLAGYPPETAQEIAGEIQLVVDAHPRAPPGMSPTDVIRRLVRMQLLGILPLKAD